jgi:hypothetical protein
MENIFVEFLPPWVETGLQPAFYDKESGTVLQQTARMYARVNMLIRMFNKLSKNTKETVENYINQFNELHNYVHDYFDNLDVQEEINNKLDAMVEDGTLQEIITSYIQSNVAWTFNTVADMKASTNLIAGSYAQTLGFYSLDDGGGALYYITDTGTANEMDVIAVGELYANLVTNKNYNIRQFGAYGDGTHDDHDVIQYVFNKNGNVYCPDGIYLLGSTINITNHINETKTFVIDADEAEFLYTNTSYAFDITKTSNAIFNIGSIISETGGCLYFHSTGVSDFVQHITINFKVMQGGNGEDGVFAETSGDGWINEIHLNDGTFYRNSRATVQNCVHIAYGCNNWNFNRVALVGGNTGVKFENTNTEHSMGHFTFNECRYSESVDKFIEATGWVKDVFINDINETQFYRISTDADCNNWYAYSVDNIASHLVNGVWQFSKYIKTLEGGSNVGSNADFNDFTTPGDYNFNQSTSILSASHKPTTRSLGKLTVQTFNNFRYTTCPYIVQTYLTVDGIEFSRTYDGTNWSAWDLVNQCSQMLIPTNTNLDTLVDGSYFCDGGTLRSTLTNVPSSAASIFRVDLKRIGTKFSGTSRQQTLVDVDNNLYSRTYNGASWSAWKKISYV